jgi:hypothetical protein
MRRFSKAQKRASIHVSVISTPLLCSSTLGEDYIFLGSSLTPLLPGDLSFIKFFYDVLRGRPIFVAQFRPTACFIGGYSVSWEIVVRVLSGWNVFGFTSSKERREEQFLKFTFI